MVFKKYILGILGLVSTYLVLILFILPHFAKTFIVEDLSKQINSQIEISEIKIDPLKLDITFNDINISTKNRPLFQTKSIYFNVSIIDLIFAKFTIDKIVITDPIAYFSINQDGSIFLPDLKPSKEDKTTNAPFTLFLKLFEISNGVIFFEDQSAEIPYKKKLEHLNYIISNISTTEKNDGGFLVDAKINGSNISIKGSLNLSPIKTRGVVSIQNADLSIAQNYIDNLMSFDIKSGHLDISTKYEIVQKDKNFELILEDLEASLDKFLITDKTTTNKIISFDSAKIKKAKYNLTQNDLFINHLLVKNPFIDLKIEKNGVLNLQTLMRVEDKNESKNNTKELTFLVESIDIENLNSTIEDNFIASSFQSSIKNLNLKVSNATSKKDETINAKLNFSDISNTSFNINANLIQKENILKLDSAISNLDIGFYKPYYTKYIKIDDKTLSSVDVKSLTLIHLDNPQNPSLDIQIDFKKNGKIHYAGGLNNAKIDVQSFSLRPFEPYLKDYLICNLQSAYLNSKLSITNMRVSGDVSLDDLILTNKNEKFFSFKKLDIQKLDVNTSSLKIAKIDFINPYLSFMIREDYNTSINDILIHQQETSQKSEPFDISVDKFTLIDGSVDFEDKSLFLDFKTKIDECKGEIKNINTKSKTPSNINFKGKVGKFAHANLKGEVNLFDPKQLTNLDIKFNNLDLVSLTPYSNKFAGYNLKEGKLFTTNSININNGILDNKNNILLEKITLGEKVDTNNSLPLEFALAILKDINGNVDISIPISGDLNDPTFSYSGVIAKAFFNLIFKIVASPFSILGSLFDISEDELKNIKFTAGDANLTLKEQEKLFKLSKSLDKKPNISIKIDACYDETLDKNATKLDLLELSKKRAETLMRFLKQENIDMEKFVITDSFKVSNQSKLVECPLEVEILKK